MRSHRLVTATVPLLLLGAGPAGAADDCAAPVPELRQMTEQRSVDEVTREKIDELLEDAAELCEEGESAEAATKYDNVRDLLESDRPG